MLKRIYNFWVNANGAIAIKKSFIHILCMLAAHTFIPSLALSLSVNVENSLSLLLRLQFFQKKKNHFPSRSRRRVRTAQDEAFSLRFPLKHSQNMRCVYWIFLVVDSLSPTHREREREQSGRGKTGKVEIDKLGALAVLCNFAVLLLSVVVVSTCEILQFLPHGCSATPTKFLILVCMEMRKNCSPSAKFFWIIVEQSRQCDAGNEKDIKNELRRIFFCSLLLFFILNDPPSCTFIYTCEVIHTDGVWKKSTKLRPNAISAQKKNEEEPKLPSWMTQVCVAQIHKIKCHCLFIFIFYRSALPATREIVMKKKLYTLRKKSFKCSRDASNSQKL